MDFFSVITLIGGLAFFLYGMDVMSSGLKTMAGGKLQSSLERMTSNPFKSLALGAGITIAIQSSSALTVMLVGLVNSGIMDFSRTINVIMGSNVGTTLTTWILSLAGIEGENFFLQLLKPKNFAPVIAFVGVIFIMAGKRQRRKEIGKICVGFSVLMYGMELMSGAVAPLAEIEGFSDILVMFNNPLLGVIIGALFTGVIQSSAASVGILMALTQMGSISYGMAIPIIMGQNIGTCVTALLSSIGITRNAKRVAAVHVSFNVIGTIICMVLFYGSNAIFHFAIVDQPINSVGVAAVHSIFNIVNTIILLPFTKQLDKLAHFIVRGDGKEEHAIIDERLLGTLPVAVDECNRLVGEMGDMAKDSLLTAIALCNEYDGKKADKVLELEDNLDRYEDALGTFLIKISSRSMSDDNSREVSKLLHAIGDFERIGDHAVNILKTAEEIHDKRAIFSDDGKHELAVLVDAIKEILDITISAYHTGNFDVAARVEPLEQVIDHLIADIRSRHINRLQSGNCTIELGFIFSDLLNNYERISDHCSNIAVAIIEVGNGEFDTHRYLNDVKSGTSHPFNDNYDKFSEKYQLD